MTMTAVNCDSDDDKLTPEQARIVARARWLMLISGLATVLGIGTVVTLVGYRVYRLGDSPQTTAVVRPVEPVTATASLPRGARVTAVGTAGDRIVVTVDAGGTTEIRTFDARTLSEAGRLRFANEP